VKPYPGPLPFQGSAGPSPRQAFTYSPPPSTYHSRFDYENRLTTVTKPGYTVAYTYTADGLRLRAQESNAQYTDRWFQYDGVRPVLESTLDANGNLQIIIAKYVWAGNRYYDPLVLGYEGSAWRHPLYDGLGSTRQLINQTDQAVTDTYSYEAFGNLTGSTGSTPNPYRYVGSLGYYQTGSSLMHLGARYYMPEVGRFTRKDPGREFKPLTSYLYAQNNPLMRVDPDGFKPKKKKPPSGADLCSELCDEMFGGDPPAYAICKAGCYLIGKWEKTVGKILCEYDMCVGYANDPLNPQPPSNVSPGQWCGHFCHKGSTCQTCCNRLVGGQDDPEWQNCMDLAGCDSKGM